MPDRRDITSLSGRRRQSRLRDLIRDGELQLGTFVKSRDPAVAEALAVAGYDFVVADLEHSPLSVADTDGIVRAGDCHGVPVIARLPGTGLGLCGQLLDAGVTGIQVSDVTSARDLDGPVDASDRRPVNARHVALTHAPRHAIACQTRISHSVPARGGIIEAWTQWLRRPRSLELRLWRSVTAAGCHDPWMTSTARITARYNCHCMWPGQA